MKRVISAILAAILALSLLPFFEIETKASSTDPVSAVKQQIAAFATSINQKDAATSAAMSLLTNAAFRGKDLVFDESNAMTAMLLNSYVMQDALCHTLITTAETMRQLNYDSLLCWGGLEWRSSNGYFDFHVYMVEPNGSRLYLRSAANSKSLYGDEEYYLKYFNNNDKMLVSVAGGTEVTYVLTTDTIGKDTVRYRVDLTCRDDFNFDGDYSTTDYNRDYEKLLTAFGGMTMHDFSWEAKATFYVEIPYSCQHSVGSYRWVWDAEQSKLVSDSSGGYLTNETTKKIYYIEAETLPAEQYYHVLDQSIVLRHTQPWVVEYAAKGLVRFVLTPLEYTNNHLPYIFQYDRSYTWIGYREEFDLTPEEQVAMGGALSSHRNHYYGLRLGEHFAFLSSHTYAYRLENKIAENGTNMVYLTIIDRNTNTAVVDHVPMDGYYVENYKREVTQMGRQDSWLSGQDLTINYLGCRSQLSIGQIDYVEIYETGTSMDPADAFTTKVVVPTCSTEGYTLHTCYKCGYSYKSAFTAKLAHDYKETVVFPTCTAEGYTDYVCRVCGSRHQADFTEKLPHSITEYASNHDATCAHDGTKTGKCSNCGYLDIVPDIGTQLPHDWADATCTKPQTCKSCGATEGAALGHAVWYANGKAPTCTDVGWAAYEKCSRCKYSTFQQIPASGHDFINNRCANCGLWDGLIQLGDVNADGLIDTTDAYLIVMCYNEMTELADEQLLAADVNGDGEVDTTDAYYIVMFYNEMIESFPIENP